MVVGQDWGDTSYFLKRKGLDQPTGNPTNTNLQELLGRFGISIKEPCEPQVPVIFLTNIILCLKNGGLQAPVKDEWFSNCAESFFRDLVSIVQPKIIMALGKTVSETILKLYGVPFSKSSPLNRLMESAPFKLTETTYLFPVYHCGAGSVNRNRPLEKQHEDWMKAAEWCRTSLIAENGQ